MKKLIGLLIGLLFISVAAHADESVEAAVRNYISQMTPEQIAKSDAYFEGGYWLQIWNYLMAMATAAILMYSGLGQKVWGLSRKISRFFILQAGVYFALYILLVSLIGLPLTVYQDYFREHQYGLSNLTFGHWVIEQLKGLAIGIILFSIFGAIVYTVIRKMQRTWWVGATIATSLFMVITILISPVYLAPIFNEYQPLRQGEVREATLALARANGVPVDEVYEFNASKQSKRISANVSGIFNTMRVSLNDNLLNRTTVAETRHVMGHEIGHYVLNHVYKHLIMFCAILFIGFFCVSRGMDYFIRRYGSKFNVRQIDDLTGAPVLLALLTTFLFILTPINNSIIRSAETEADLFALNSAREPDAAAHVALLLSEYRKISPGYWEEVFFYDHPSGENRIRAAMTWKAQNLK